MGKRLVAAVAGLILGSSALLALDSEGRSVTLVPEPKEVHLRDGGFRLGRHTKILVQWGYQSEDRIAAETLVEEISDQSGLQLNIVGRKPASKAQGGSIVLARLQDKRVRKFLKEQGLNADSLTGQDGYVLFSDKSHLIVAANSGEGIFAGVQTLRQLLRPEGKDFIVPAVTIRDWPNLQRTPQDLSQAQFPKVSNRP